MKTNLYAMLPAAVLEWERRKLDAMTVHNFPRAELSIMPRSEVSEDTKREIADYMDETREFIKQRFAMMFNQRREFSVKNGVGVIHINDYLGGNLTFFDRCLGASDYADIAADIRRAEQAPDVREVLLEIDSGGGSAAGCVEVGRMVARLDAIKPVTAYTSSLCCSAAYAIAVGARERYASPSALVGCIGTIMTWLDYSAMAEMEGIAPHILTNEGADLKASANMFREPTLAEMQHLQETADEYGMQFQEFVIEQNHRIDSEQGFRGQAVSGREAVRLGFIGGTLERAELLQILETATR